MFFETWCSNSFNEFWDLSQIRNRPTILENVLVEADFLQWPFFKSGGTVEYSKERLTIFVRAGTCESIQDFNRIVWMGSMTSGCFKIKLHVFVVIFIEMWEYFRSCKTLQIVGPSIHLWHILIIKSTESEMPFEAGLWHLTSLENSWWFSVKTLLITLISSFRCSAASYLCCEGISAFSAVDFSVNGCSGFFWLFPCIECVLYSIYNGF